MNLSKLKVLTFLSLFFTNLTWSAATISIIVEDDINEGFNDTTPVTPVGGNTGTTLGEQRLKVFERAAELWGEVINSSVEIKIAADFDVQTCTETSATLGSAGSNFIFRNFNNAPFPNTFYSAALADSIAGFDQNPGAADINTTFNSAIDTGCFNDGWYYGLDGNTPNNQTPLLPVVLHELGHGFGFQTFTSGSSGEFISSTPSIWDRFLFDLTQNQSWSEMATNADRTASAINGPNLVWTGPNVTAKFPEVLDNPIVLEITSPEAISGTFDYLFATFSADVPQTGISGNLILTTDNSGSNANDGCSPITNNVSGQVAFIQRGNCGFNTKAINAQNAGATAVVVMNNEPGNVFMGGDNIGITIPVVSISQEDGNTILPLFSGTISIELKYDPSSFAGANGGFVMMHAPDPHEPGSSVSHFSTAASPNLLMEPRISSNLFEQVDLSRELFQDIGWSVNSETTPANDVIFENGFETQ